AELACEKFVHRRNRTGRLVQSDALHAVHGKEHRRESYALTVGLIHLADEMIERIQVNAAQRDARRINGQQFAPHLFLRCVQADNHDGMRLHEFSGMRLFLAYRELSSLWFCRMEKVTGD